MMQPATTIILCGGQINYSNLPIGTTQSNAMIPINGKPVIAWILNDLLDKGIHTATVVLREQDQRLQDFLRRAYHDRMDITLAPLTHQGTIIQSVQAGLRQHTSDGPVRIILGDTLIRDPFTDDRDFVYVSQVEESRRWCVVFTNSRGQMVDLVDKQELTLPGPILALAGYYQLQHGEHLKHCVESCVANGERELSRILLRYNARYPIAIEPVTQWFDFGNIDNLVDARRRLLQPRHFNELVINPVLNTITKSSEDDQKLADELDWYLNIPDELKVLAPRIVSHRRVNGRLHIVQEYYGYPTLAELFVYGDLHSDVWKSILRHVMRIYREFRRFPGQMEQDEIRRMYSEKTWQRLDSLRKQSVYWASLLDCETLTLNGKPLRNILALREQIEARAEKLASNGPISVVHGDYCFSNILFDVPNQIVRLIDPRGSFGKKGIYGDPRYDMAKLRHSACGLYDYIVADMFEIGVEAGGFSATIYANGTARLAGAALDRMIVEAGYDLDEIRFIEGLLFISMTPLHQDRLQRQQIMYLTGLSLLNEVFPCAS